ncbi:hypothetical protein [Paraburkholderia kururiensis]|uniref:hypothetical protein n=1 Tax=Paraburkholderia kururiensis TaxID=984307 RepID=UPI0039A62018
MGGHRARERRVQRGRLAKQWRCREQKGKKTTFHLIGGMFRGACFFRGRFIQGRNKRLAVLI